VVDDKLNEGINAGAKGLSDSTPSTPIDLEVQLRMLYEIEIKPRDADLIVECDDMCRGNFDALRTAYVNKFRATHNMEYAQDINRIERLQKIQRELKESGFKLDDRPVDLVYLAERYESERPSFQEREPETKVIRKYLNGDAAKTGTGG